MIVMRRNYSGGFDRTLIDYKQKAMTTYDDYHNQMTDLLSHTNKATAKYDVHKHWIPP